MHCISKLYLFLAVVVPLHGAADDAKKKVCFDEARNHVELFERADSSDVGDASSSDISDNPFSRIVRFSSTELEIHALDQSIQRYKNEAREADVLHSLLLAPIHLHLNCLATQRAALLAQLPAKAPLFKRFTTKKGRFIRRERAPVLGRIAQCDRERASYESRQREIDDRYRWQRQELARKVAQLEVHRCRLLDALPSQ